MKSNLNDSGWKDYFMRNGLPETCGECPLYLLKDYTCHNESGKESVCKAGYMQEDMRDKNFDKKLYNNCKLKDELQR